MGVAFVMGGPTELIITNTGIYQVDHGNIQSFSQVVDPFDQIQISGLSHRLEIRQGQEFRVEGRLNQTPTIAVNQGILEINTQRPGQVNVAFTIMGPQVPEQLIVYVPAGTVIEDIQVDMFNGRVMVDQLDIRGGLIRTTNGRIDVTNSALSHTELRTSNGRIYARDVYFREVTAITSNGRIDVFGELHGHTRLTTSNARVNAQVRGSIEDFGYNLRSSGRIDVDNGRLRVSGNLQNHAANAGVYMPNFLEITTSSGRIDVNFQ